MGKAMQAVLGAAHHQDLVYPDKPYRLGAQLNAVLGALGVSVEQTYPLSHKEPPTPSLACIQFATLPWFVDFNICLPVRAGTMFILVTSISQCLTQCLMHSRCSKIFIELKNECHKEYQTCIRKCHMSLKQYDKHERHFISSIFCLHCSCVTANQPGLSFCPITQPLHNPPLLMGSASYLKFSALPKYQPQTS